MRRVVVLFAGSALLAGCASAPRAEPAPVVQAPSDPAIVRMEPWSLGVHAGQVVVTPRFRLFSTDVAVWGDATSARFAEATMSRLELLFPDLPPGPEHLELFIVRSPSEAALVADRLSGAARPPGRGVLAGIAADGRAIVTTSPERSLEPVLAHEIWHQFVQSRFVEPLPAWLDEALACAMEGHTRDGSGVIRFDADHNPPRARTLARLVSTDPRDAAADAGSLLSYYAQAWALGAMILDDPRWTEGLRAVARAAALGRLDAALDPDLPRHDAVLVAITGMDARQLEPAYRDYVTWLADRVRQTRPAPAQGPGARPGTTTSGP